MERGKSLKILKYSYMDYGRIIRVPTNDRRHQPRNRTGARNKYYYLGTAVLNLVHPSSNYVAPCADLCEPFLVLASLAIAHHRAPHGVHRRPQPSPRCPQLGTAVVAVVAGAVPPPPAAALAPPAAAVVGAAARRACCSASSLCHSSASTRPARILSVSPPPTGGSLGRCWRSPRWS
eukprot:SAG22_NODE_295_length_12850_cov_9.179202_6_plen_177_part_00